MSNRIQGTTGLIGLIGDPLKHSRSPHMHNSAFDKLGLDYVYLCFEVPKGELKNGIEALKTFSAKGSNITFPHKQEVLKYLDDISEDAKIIGSVNTIKIDSETKKITGYNTDGRGFIASLDELKIPFRKQKVVLVGVGGAGRAIAIQLAYEGVGELCIKELNKDLANEIKETINKHIPNVNVKILADATPLGMKGRENLCVISGPEVLHKDLFVYDIVYDPRETLLMKYAKQAGCQTTNGINMMIWQGAIAFKIWFDIDMPQDYVRQELFEK